MKTIAVTALAVLLLCFFAHAGTTNPSDRDIFDEITASDKTTSRPAQENLPALLLGIAFTYAIGLAPALILRFVFLRRPLVKKGRLKYLGVLFLYMFLLVFLFTILAHLSGGKYAQSIHTYIASFIACYMLFSGKQTKVSATPRSKINRKPIKLRTSGDVMSPLYFMVGCWSFVWGLSVLGFCLAPGPRGGGMLALCARGVMIDRPWFPVLAAAVVFAVWLAGCLIAQIFTWPDQKPKTDQPQPPADYQV